MMEKKKNAVDVVDEIREAFKVNPLQKPCNTYKIIMILSTISV